MNIKFASCFLDHSGYGQAARDMLKALVDVGVNVTTEIITFQQSSDKNICPLAVKLKDKKIPYKVKLIMLTPEQAMLKMESGKYNIEFLFWEVLGVDPKWVNYMNFMDEIWTPSKTFADTFKDEGVKSPIFVVKQPTVVTQAKPFCIPDFDGFLFYSMFQWTERKNPRGLLKTFWETFEGKKDVGLLIKTYRGSFLEAEKEAIRREIRGWKSRMGLSSYPPVFLALNELNSKDIMRLHATGDCFVSAHRGEGWGYPQMEAMTQGKPIISTNFGGIHESLDESVAWLIPHTFQSVHGMDHIPWYNPTQLWADPDYRALGGAMRQAYEDVSLTKKKGKAAQKLMKEEFSFEEVGLLMKRRLEKI
jgi:glycosyltransferase involved in cell wall biosynthesis